MRISDWSSDVCSSDLAVTDDGATGEGAGAWPATGRTGMPYQCPWADATQVARTRAGTHAVTQPRRERTGLRRTGVRGSQRSGIRSAGVLLDGPWVGARRAWVANPPIDRKSKRLNSSH